MKKYLLTLAAAAMGATSLVAQSIWSVPTVYMPDEEVTWYIDLSDYMQRDGEDMYIWTWAPSNPEELAGNPDGWNSPSEFSHLNYVGEGVYSLTIVPTEYYQITAEQAFANDDIFWFNIRALRDGAMADPTGSLHAPRPFNLEYQEFLTADTDVKVYPANFTYKDNISILVNIANLYVNGEKGALVGKDFGDLHFHSGINEWDGKHNIDANMGDAVLREKTKLKKVSDTVYKLDMLPQDYYGITDEELLAGYAPANITGQFPTTDWAYLALHEDGSPWKLLFAGVEPDPDPVFSYFPAKFSKLDIVTFTRQYDNSATNLKFTITGGSTTFSGEFGGSRARRVATANLFDALKNEGDIDQIHVVISRVNSDTPVEELDIPLVKVSEID